MNAKSPPSEYPQLHRDIMPVLAVLAAQGPDRARLLTADAFARLITATNLSTADILAQPVASGAVTAVPLTNSLFPPGVSFYLGGGVNNSGALLSGPYLVTNNDGKTITFKPSAAQAYQATDVILAVPTVSNALAPLAPTGVGGSWATITPYPKLARAPGDYQVTVQMGPNKGMVFYYYNDLASARSVQCTGIYFTDPDGNGTQLILSGPLIAPGGEYILKIYPGLAAAANDTANSILGQNVRIIMTVTAGAGTCIFTGKADLLP